MARSNDPTTSDVRRHDNRNGKAKKSERTPPQVHVAPFGVTQPELRTNYPTHNWFTFVRQMRVDPTISLVRDLVVGPIVATEWSVGHTKDAPEGAAEFVLDQVQNLRNHLVVHSLNGWMDYGWVAFEKVWAIDSQGQTIIDKAKPLLHDITILLIDNGTGEFLGTVQNAVHDKPFETRVIGNDLVTGTAFLKTKDVILTNINVEGTYWYGRAIMHNEVLPYNNWNTVNNAADQYDKKIAGSHWVIHYPYGTTKLDGRDQDNFEVAKLLIKNLESSGAIAVPRHIEETIIALNQNKEVPDAWKIELLSDQTNQQSNFIDRLKYLDTLKVRGLGFPERSVLEGKFGTKAEAEVHSDLAVVIAEYRHEILTEHMSRQVVNDLMRYNYGKETIGSVYLKPAPIADDTKSFLRSIFQTLMQHDPETALDKIDANEVKEQLGLPTVSDSDDSATFDFPEKPDPVANQAIGPGTGLNPVEGENTSNGE